MKKALKIVWKAVKWGFIVFCVYLGSLFFREQTVSGVWVERLFDRYAPTNLVLNVESVTVGFRRGICLRGIRLYDSSMTEPTRALVGAETLSFDPYRRELFAVGLTYTRLPDSYYAPGNQEKNARVECELPDLGVFKFVLIRPDILGIRARRLTGTLTLSSRRADFGQLHLVWPDADRKIVVDGFCHVDLDKQEVYGEIDGHAWQSHIRPLLLALDVPVSLPYFDGFTEVPEPCKSWCAWKVDLVRNDFDLWLDLRPVLGRYNAVPMKRANGKIHLHNYTRGTCLNYLTTVGPIAGVDLKGRNLEGTVTITGTNNYNVVDVKAKSSQPLADVLKIGGFTGDYVGNDVFGDSVCDLQFRFPRAMSNNYEVLNGYGHVTVKNGQLMRMKGFQGLIDAMPRVAPAVTWFTDSTQASADYVIENGVIRTDGVYIEGSLFSIKMYGAFDAVRNDMDFTVRVQFTKNDSMLGKVLHPLTWPFTKLLLEFKLTGSPENPRWKYVSVVDRVLEVVK